MFENLDARILTGLTTGVQVDERELPGFATFGGLSRNVVGNVAVWDELLPSREIVKDFEGRRAIATPTDPQGVRERSATFITSFKKRYMFVEEFDALRAPGSTDAGAVMSAEQARNMVVGDMNRRYRVEPLEYLIWGALQDNLSFTVDRRTVTPDFGLALTHDLTAGTAWSNAAADIEADVETCKRLIAQDSGMVARHAWCGRNVFRFIRKNTVVLGWLQGYVGADTRWTTLQGESFELFGIQWHSITRGYTLSGTWTPYLADDKVIFTPDPSMSWFQMLYGKVKYPTAVYGDIGNFVDTYGVATYAKLHDEPPSMVFFMRWRGLPVLVFPSAVVCLDVSP